MSNFDILIPQTLELLQSISISANHKVSENTPSQFNDTEDLFGALESITDQVSKLISDSSNIGYIQLLINFLFRLKKLHVDKLISGAIQVDSVPKLEQIIDLHPGILEENVQKYILDCKRSPKSLLWFLENGGDVCHLYTHKFPASLSIPKSITFDETKVPLLTLGVLFNWSIESLEIVIQKMKKNLNNEIFSDSSHLSFTLSIAVRLGYTEIVSLLCSTPILESDGEPLINPNIIDPISNLTVLNSSVLMGWNEMTQTLLKCSAIPDIDTLFIFIFTNSSDDDNFRLCLPKIQDILSHFLFKCPENLFNSLHASKGISPLHFAVKRGNLLLLKTLAKLSDKNSEKKLNFHLKTNKNHCILSYLLLEENKLWNTEKGYELAHFLVQDCRIPFLDIHGESDDNDNVDPISILYENIQLYSKHAPQVDLKWANNIFTFFATEYQRGVGNEKDIMTLIDSPLLRAMKLCE